jgi:hypothetical protein
MTVTFPSLVPSRDISEEGRVKLLNYLTRSLIWTLPTVDGAGGRGGDGVEESGSEALPASSTPPG